MAKKPPEGPEDLSKKRRDKKKEGEKLVNQIVTSHARDRRAARPQVKITLQGAKVDLKQD